MWLWLCIKLINIEAKPLYQTHWANIRPGKKDAFLPNSGMGVGRGKIFVKTKQQTNGQ